MADRKHPGPSPFRFEIVIRCPWCLTPEASQPNPHCTPCQKREER